MADKKQLEEIIMLAAELGDKDTEIAALEQLIAIEDEEAARKATEAERIARVTGGDTRTADERRMGQEVSAAEAFQSSLGRGFAKTGRGISTLFNQAQELVGFDQSEDLARLEREREQEKQAFEVVEEKQPIAATAGQLVGEIAATAPLGMGAAAGAAKLTPAAGRLAGLLPAATAGGVEGLVIGADEGQALTGAGIGVAAGGLTELLLPKIGRVARRLFGKNAPDAAQLVVQLPDGSIRPTVEFDEALKAAGTSFDNITKEGLEEAPKGVSPSEMARRALYEAEGITPTKSRITQTTDDLQREIQLSRLGGQGGQDMRDAAVRESQQIRERLNSLAPQYGLPENAGGSIKDALDGLNSSIQSQKSDAYKVLGEMSEIGGMAADEIPVSSMDIKRSILSAQKYLPNAEADKLDEIMARYGLIGEKPINKGRFTEVVLARDESGNVIDSINFRGEPERLTVGSLEDFRQQFGRIFNMQDARQAAASREVVGAVDDEIDTILSNVGEQSFSQEIIDQAKKARGLARKQKLIFNQKDLVNRLTGNKPGTVTPLVESSKVYDEIRRATPEQSQKLFSALRGAGDSGQEAIQNLKSAAVVNLIDGGFEKGGKIGMEGTEEILEFNGKQFTGAINRFGRKKLNELFKDEPEVLKTIANLEAIGKIKRPDKFSVQKGSAPDLINALISRGGKASKIVPFVGETIGEAAEDLAAKREVRGLLDFAPTAQEVDDFIFFNSPRLHRYITETAPSAAAIPAVSSGTERE